MISLIIHHHHHHHQQNKSLSLSLWLPWWRQTTDSMAIFCTAASLISLPYIYKSSNRPHKLYQLWVMRMILILPTILQSYSNVHYYIDFRPIQLSLPTKEGQEHNDYYCNLAAFTNATYIWKKVLGDTNRHYQLHRCRCQCRCRCHPPLPLDFIPPHVLCF